MRCFVAVLLAGLASACDDSSAAGPDDDIEQPPTGEATVSFASDVRPLFVSRCGICHYRGSPVVPDLNDALDPEFGVINFENTWYAGHDNDYEYVVRPGKPDESFLVYKVETDPDPEVFDLANNGNPMPFAIEMLTAAELSTVRQWIEDGAKNDAFFQDEVALIFGTEPSLGRKGGKCTFCHYDGSPTGLSVIDVFDAETGLVGVASTLSTKLRVKPGEPDESFLMEKIEGTPSAGAAMPMHYPRLSAAELETLRTWIAEGARDN
jgi:hypothetical protein